MVELACELGEMEEDGGQGAAGLLAAPQLSPVHRVSFKLNKVYKIMMIWLYIDFTIELRFSFF